MMVVTHIKNRKAIQFLVIVALGALILCGCGNKQESLKEQLINESPWIDTKWPDEAIIFYSDGTGTVGDEDQGERFTWFSPNDEEIQIVESSVYSSSSDGGGLTKKRFSSNPGTFKVYIEHNENSNMTVSIEYNNLYLTDEDGTTWIFESSPNAVQSLS